MSKRKIWIYNKWVESAPGINYDDLAHFPIGDNGDVYLAIEAARNAYPVSFLTRCLISAADRR